jgi:uncharacterized delta-60 repeat protein
VWNRTHDSGNSDYANGVAVDSSGNVYVTGSFSNGNNSDYYTIKYNSTGDIVWNRTHDYGGSDAAYDIVVDSSGNVYVTGHSSEDYHTIKYNSTGDIIWNRTYSRGNDYANGVAVDSSGNVYVTGQSYFGSWDYLTIKYNSTGALIWNRTYDDSGSVDQAKSVAVDSYGGIYITGSSSLNYFTIKYNSTGDVVWNRTPNSGNAIDANSVAVDSSGFIYVTGFSSIGSNDNYHTIKYNSTGDTVWSKTYDSGFNDEARGVAVDLSGNVYVTGMSNFSNNEYNTIKYAQTTSLYFTVDTTPPTITIDSPTNTTYNTTTIELNASADDTTGTWWYQYNGNGTNISFTPNTTFFAGGSDGLKNITVWTNDSAGNENYSVVYFTKDINELPNFANPIVTPNAGGWGETFTFNVTVTDSDSDNVTCTLYTNTSGTWVARSNVTVLGGNGNCSLTVSNFDTTDYTYNQSNPVSFKFEIDDGNPINVYNTSISYGPYFEKDDVVVTLVSGNNSYVDRLGGNVDLMLRFYDSDKGIYLSSGVNGTFWVTVDGANYSTGLTSVTNATGHIPLSFDPDCTYAVGGQNWKGGVTDPWYKTVNSTSYNLDIYGNLINSISSPNGETYNQSDSIIMRTNVTDDCSASVSSAAVSFNITYNATTQFSCSPVNNETGANAGYYNCTWDSTAKPTGWYNVSVDSSKTYYNGNTTTKANAFELTETTKPTITVDSPTNTTYNTTSISLVVSADENVSAWWYQYNGNGTNITFTPNTTFFAGGGDGLKNITVYANDSAGNENYSVVYFTLDTTAPPVIIFYPQNGTNTSDNTPLLNVTFGGETVEAAWITIGGGSAQNYSYNVTTLTFDLDQLSDGLNNVTVYANDTAGNENSTTVYFTVNTSTPDTTPPTISFDPQTPVNDFNSTNSTISIKVNHNESNPDTLILSWNGTNETYSYYSPEAVGPFGGGGGPCGAPGYSNGSNTIQKLCLADGTYSYYVWVNDTAGNSNATEIRTINIDSVAYNNGSGRGFGNIQAVIDDNETQTGHTILVDAGTYTENVDVNKSVNLVGAGAGVTVVTANDSNDHVFDVSADSVNISGFTVTGATTSAYAGIYLDGSAYSKIENVNATGNYDGITLWSSSNYNTLVDNFANSNTRYGIFLDSSNSNTIANNNASNNSQGINLQVSDNNNLSNNTATNNIDGVGFSSSDNNKLINNSANDNTQYGIKINTANNNTIVNNTASNNDEGINFVLSNNTILTDNIISNNNLGIYYWSSSNNTFYNNHFNNTQNIDFLSIVYGNDWNTTNTSGPNINSGPSIGGNLWAHLNGTGFSETCNDLDSDGFCDTSYTLASGNVDYLPLAEVAGQDLTPPSVTIISPTNTTTNDSTPLLNVTFGETVNTTWIEIDGGVAQNYSFNVTNIAFDLDTLLDGFHNVTVYASDYSGNVNNTEVVYFTIDTTPPNITVDSPTNDTYYTKEIWFNVTVGEPADWCWYSLDQAVIVNMNNSNSTNWYSVNSSMTDGSHNVKFYCNDTVGNTNNSAVVYFTVDTTRPTITVDSPQNGSLYSSFIELNVSADEVTSSWWYQYNGNGTNITFTPNTTFFAGGADGLKNITVWTNDTGGNESSRTIYFTLDGTPPGIQIASEPASPVDQDSTQYITWAVTDSNVDSYIIKKDNVDNVTGTYTNGSNITIAVDTSSLGTVNYTLIVNDSAGNVNSSEVLVTVEDQKSVTIEIIYPQKGHVFFTSKIITITFNAQDRNGVSIIWYRIDGTAKVFLNNGSLKPYHNNSVDLTGFSNGSHNLTIFANDTYGNNKTVNVSFTLNTTYLTYLETLNNNVTSDSNLDLESNLSGTTLNSSDVFDSNVDNSTLVDANVSNSTISESTNVTGSTVAGSNVTESTLTNATISDSTNVTGSSVAGSNVTESTLTNATISDSTNVTGSTVEESNVTESTLTNATISDSTNVTGSTVEESNVTESTLTNATISESTNVTGSTVEESNITESVITNATISDSTNVSNSTLQSSSVSGSTLDSVTTYNTNISNSNLLNATVSNAEINDDIIGGSTNATIELTEDGITVNFTNVYEDVDVDDLLTNTNVTMVNISVNETITVVNDTDDQNYSVTVDASGTINGTMTAAETPINPGGKSLPNKVSGTKFLFIDAPNFNSSVMRAATIRMKHYSSCSEFTSINITRFNESDPTSDWQNLVSWCDGDYIYANTTGFSVFGVSGEVSIYIPPSPGGGPDRPLITLPPVKEEIEEILTEEVEEIVIAPAIDIVEDLLDSDLPVQLPPAPPEIFPPPTILQSILAMFTSIAAVKIGSIPVGKAALGGTAAATAACGAKLISAKAAAVKVLSVNAKEKLLGISADFLPIPFFIGKLKYKFDHPTLENGIRVRIFTEVIQNPGIHFRAIQRRVDVSSGTINWHIKILESAGLIKSEKSEYYKQYYPASGIVDEAYEDFVHNPTRRGIVEMVISSPGMTQIELAEKLDIHPSTVFHHIKQLVESGVIAEVRDGKTRKYFSLVVVPRL